MRSAVHQTVTLHSAKLTLCAVRLHQACLSQGCAAGGAVVNCFSQLVNQEGGRDLQVGKSRGWEYQQALRTCFSILFYSLVRKSSKVEYQQVERWWLELFHLLVNCFSQLVNKRTRGVSAISAGGKILSQAISKSEAPLFPDTLMHSKKMF